MQLHVEAGTVKERCRVDTGLGNSAVRQRFVRSALVVPIRTLL
jgi:hypothetical protein